MLEKQADMESSSGRRESPWQGGLLGCGGSLAGRVEEKAGAVGQSWKMIKTHTGGETHTGEEAGRGEVYGN